MGNYYIKNIWGPGGQGGYPYKNRMGFADGQEQAAQRFTKCDGFLIRETGGKEGEKVGAKAIYAQGTVQMPSKIIINQAEMSKKESGKKIFPYDVKINLSRRINPLNGVPLNTIRKILESPKEDMQRQGGLIEITKDQFDKLCLELEKCFEKLSR